MTPYYEEAGITIWHGDCREILPVLPKVDLILADPPYGINADKNKRANKQHGKAAAPSKDYGAGTWDDKRPPAWIWRVLAKKADWLIIFGGNYFPLPPSKCWLVWDKQNGANGYADCELAWTNLDKAVRKLSWKWQGMLQEDMAHKEFREHPTQKPVPVMKWALSQAPDTVRTVLDPFMGSGTTLVACKQAGLSCVGIEREERYAEIAANRLRQGVLWGAV
mgnify:CR=1 FL=1